MSGETSDVRPSSKKTREEELDNSSASDEELEVKHVFTLRPNELTRRILQATEDIKKAG